MASGVGTLLGAFMDFLFPNRRRWKYQFSILIRAANSTNLIANIENNVHLLFSDIYNNFMTWFWKMLHFVESSKRRQIVKVGNTEFKNF